MDLTDPHTFRLFLEVYGTLPRAGPGGDEHTLRALRLVPGREPHDVLDVGCGPGAQTVCLARALPAARIVAVDVVEEMVREANRRLAAAGVAERARAVTGDMAQLLVTPGSQDLIWCEGAIYFMGVAEALRAWRPLLRGEGTVAFTEPVWLSATPPQEVRSWWLSEYPAMSDDAGIRDQVQRAGYRTVDTFTLPASAWWEDYYSPMRARVAALEARVPDDPAAAAVVRTARTEIDMFQRFSEHYSYAFYVVQASD